MLLSTCALLILLSSALVLLLGSALVMLLSSALVLLLSTVQVMLMGLHRDTSPVEPSCCEMARARHSVVLVVHLCTIPPPPTSQMMLSAGRAADCRDGSAADCKCGATAPQGTEALIEPPTSPSLLALFLFFVLGLNAHSPPWIMTAHADAFLLLPESDSLVACGHTLKI